ncbi:MAG: PEP-CTERM sorting domain-containing protein [Caldilineaceae bacterium]|nr:PEP-CTERM sorting domain-containing protein [Caldilineaceae bacterium]
MREASTKQVVVLATTLLLLAMVALPGWNATGTAWAQDGSQALVTETAATEPATPTPTDTGVPPTDTPTPTATNTSVATPTDTTVPPVTDTATPVPTVTLTSTPIVSPPSGPVPVPEPITVVLFGTGLAALSAAVAARRKNNKE